MTSSLKQRYLMYISYIGTGFRGCQFQKGTSDSLSNTIQGTVAAALTEFLNISSNNLISTYVTSRTDAGVHAFKNALHFDVPLACGKKLKCDSIKGYLNKNFMKKEINIRVLEVLEVPDIFNARKSAYEKTYIYRIAVPKQKEEKYKFPLIESHRTHFLSYKDLDLEKIQEVEKLFVGEKDFGAFVGKASKYKNSTICKLKSFKIRKSLPFMEDWNSTAINFDCYHFICIGNRFLYHMVRRLVGVALSVGNLRLSLPEVQQMFDKPDASSWPPFVSVVPGYGLYLADIKFLPEHLIISEEEKKEKRTVKRSLKYLTKQNLF